MGGGAATGVGTPGRLDDVVAASIRYLRPNGVVKKEKGAKKE